MNLKFNKLFLPFLLSLFISLNLYGQGVTSASISGKVVDDKNAVLMGANIMATHVPSGTIYGASSRADGKFNILGMRVGGPYKVVASFIGFKSQTIENVYLSLGNTSEVNFKLSESGIEMKEVTVEGKKDVIFNPQRTGASVSIQSDNITYLPTISRRIGDLTRLTPQAKGNSFLGQDNRYNNITVDGSYFNNSFGLAGQPGERTGVSPISLDAIEQIQVNMAPFDVRQGNFVGANVNTVTKSGTNEYSGSIYYSYRNEKFYGTEAKEKKFDPGKFNYNLYGLRIGGPIIKDKLFFFASVEIDNIVQPGTTYIARPDTNTATGGNVTRVLASDMDGLSSFLSSKFGYTTGPYQGYNFETPAKRYLLRLDYNLDQNNKISLRYSHLDSQTDVLVSNSSSLGAGNRRSRIEALNFQNSNYIILENIRSIIGEWNSVLGSNMANNLLIGYRYHDESRDPSRSTMFPFVDVRKDGSTYTSFGFEPFTPNNELRYNSFQVQDNFSYFLPKHNLLFGVSYERYYSENVFFPGSQSVYVYNSLNDFYTDANGYLTNPNRDTTNVRLSLFQLRWSNIPGQEKPIQPLTVHYTGVYAQDEFDVLDNLKVTAGIRVDIPFFEKTGYKNTEVEGFTFRDEKGNQVKYATDKLPDPRPLWSPRLGFNFDVFGDRSTQVRGGSGIFTGQPAFVWISNQIGNNGILTGFESLTNTYKRPFNPNINRYKPANVTGNPASNYELALTDPEFKFPQVWRNNIAVDQKIPIVDLIGTLEFIYSKDINGVYYINANLPAASSEFNGVDKRLRYAANKIVSKIDNAIVLKNQNIGYSYNFTVALEKPMTNTKYGAFYGKAAYSYGISKNTVDPGSIAYGTWSSNPTPSDPNNPGLSFSAFNPDHRGFLALSYKYDYFNFGSTTLSVFMEAFTGGRTSYVFNGDANNDGGRSNDLIYVPASTDEMNFEQYTSSGKTFTVDQQKQAWENYINNDEYLKTRRGLYAERNGVKLPGVFRMDLSLQQEFYTQFLSKKNSIIVRLDIINFTNLLNKNWGVGQQLVTSQPLTNPSADSQGRLRYRLQNISGELVQTPLTQTLTLDDVYKIQLSFRYMFN